MNENSRVCISVHVHMTVEGAMNCGDRSKENGVRIGIRLGDVDCNGRCAFSAFGTIQRNTTRVARTPLSFVSRFSFILWRAFVALSNENAL